MSRRIDFVLVVHILEFDLISVDIKDLAVVATRAILNRRLLEL
jgi:hypothetical protein